MRRMRQLGLAALAPKPALSRPDPEHRVDPSLLRGVTVTGPDPVWRTDLPSLRRLGGFGSLAAILDGYSRKVLAGRLSHTLEPRCCLDCRDDALRVGRPVISNSDQGGQFTRLAFTGRRAAAGIRISMAGRGRAHDHILVERWWQSVHYAAVYLNGYETVDAAYQGLHRYFEFYNYQRPHQTLDYRTPTEVSVDRTLILSPTEAEGLP